mgnify:CR=1 FL=1|tara:strand:+ start:165 stop:878 length:714 start_codon:yes stop_codon:yes gene_type:complete
MKEVIAMHGWSANSDVWEPWIKAFQESGWIWQSYDRGYQSVKSYEIKWTEKMHKSKISPVRRAVIAHSLGIHLLDRKVLSEATDIVLLCSFGRFIPPCRENRAIKIGLQGMRKTIGTKQEITMINNFIKKAYYPQFLTSNDKRYLSKAITPEGSEILLKDLDLLINTNGLPPGFPKDARVLAIESEQDAIIHQGTKVALIEDLNKLLLHRPTHWIMSNQGHMLFSSQIDAQILEWLE